MANLLVAACAVVFFATMSRLFPSTATVISKFPEIYYGHTGVYVIEESKPSRPAYMVMHNNRPLFYDLYTNQSIGTAYDYVKGLPQSSHPFHNILLTQPLYKGRTLHELVTRIKPPRHSPDSTIQKIYARRRMYWWKRLDRQFRELRGEVVEDEE